MDKLCLIHALEGLRRVYYNTIVISDKSDTL